jgi:hypothetical protein
VDKAVLGLIKMLATTMKIPSELIDELQGSKFEIEESELFVQSSIVDGFLPGYDAVKVTVIVTKPGGEKLPFHLDFPYVLMARLPVSIQTKIAEVQI